MRHSHARGLVVAVAAVCVLSAVGRAQQTGAGRGGIGNGPIIGAAPAPAQPLPEGTGAISGTVVDARTGEPIDGATVAISVEARAPVSRVSREITDDRGRFVFTKLPPRDDYQLVATKPGYFDSSDGRSGASASASRQRFELVDGQWLQDAKLTMSRVGAVTGTVLDERGDPVAGVYVRALARLRIAGTTEFAAGVVALTDDRGAYRLTDLGPGEYVIEVPSVQATVPASVTTGLTGASAPFAVFDPDAGSRLALGHYPIPPPPAGGTPFAYPITFSPGTTSPERATTVTVTPGEDRTDVNVRLAPVAAARIRGRVDGPPDALSGLTLRLMPAGLEDLGGGSESATALVAADGTFALLNVPDGSYTLIAQRAVAEFVYAPGGGVPRVGQPVGFGSFGTTSNDVSIGPPGLRFTVSESGPAGNEAFSGRLPLSVSGTDLGDVVVTLHRGVSIAGHVTWDLSPNGHETGFSVAAEPADGHASLGMPRWRRAQDDPPNDFAIDGLGVGSYVLRFGSTALVKSITWQSRDYTTRPFDAAGDDFTGVQVTLTDRAPTLAGTMRGESTGSPGPPDDMLVVVFPADRNQWSDAGLSPPRLKATRSTNRGAFTFTTLPAGDYLVAAIPAADGAAWQDPTVLEQLATSATHVSLDWGKSSTADLVVQRIR